MVFTCPAGASPVSPAPLPEILNCGETLAGTDAVFSVNDPNAPAGRLYQWFINNGEAGVPTTSKSLSRSGLPSDGSTIVKEVHFSDDDGLTYQVGDFCECTAFTEGSPPAEKTAESVNLQPPPGSTLTGSSQLFSWTLPPGWESSTAAGSSFDSNDYFPGGALIQRSSQQATGLPTDGSTIFYRLACRNPETGLIETLHFQYTAATLAQTAFEQRVNELLSSPSRCGDGRNTTGGAAAGEFTWVTSLNDSGPGTLREALTSGDDKWIRFDPSIQGGTIALQSPIGVFQKGITVDAAGSDVKIRMDHNGNGLLFWRGNSIVHGLEIDKNQSTGQGLMLRDGTDYWIDHVTVHNGAADDALSSTQGSNGSPNDITVSNYHTYNNSFGYLGGALDNSPRNDGMRITVVDSWFETEDRNPKFKNWARGFVLNNYISNFRFSGISSGTNTTIVAENNVLSGANAVNGNNALQTTANDGPARGVIYAGGNQFLNGAGQSSDVQPLSAKPAALQHDCPVRPTADVIAYVQANAGAANA